MFEEIGYIESLKPDKGFRLKRIIATTYSLEPQLVNLLVNVFDIYGVINQDDRNLETLASLCNSEIAKSKVIKEDCLKIFYQKDKFSYTQVNQDNRFNVLLRKCCEGMDKKDYAFHPKVILAEYMNGNHVSQHRLIISSRNLTNSDLFEVQTVIERKNVEEIEKSFDLAQLCEYINDRSKGDWVFKGLEKQNECTSLSVKPYLQTPDNDIKFMNLMKLDDENYEKIIISPFYSGLDKLKEADIYTSENIHCKMFYVTNKKRNEYILWIGSANCTTNGLRNNYEAMVAIHVQQEFDTKFKEWIEGFQKLDKNEKDNIESSRAEIEYLINNYNIKAEIEDANIHKYNLKFKLEKKENKEEVAFDFFSFYLPTTNEKGELNQDKEVIFEDISIEKVTSSLIIEYENEFENEKLIRYINAEPDEKLKELLGNIEDKLKEKKIKQIIPDYYLYSENQQEDQEEANDENSEDNEDSAESNTSNDKLTRGSLYDQDYEKLIRLYVQGKTDVIATIKDKISDKENSEYISENDLRIFEKWLEGLLDGA